MGHYFLHSLLILPSSLYKCEALVYNNYMDLFFQLPLFILAFIAFYTIPGILLLHFTKQKMNSWEQLIIGSIVGFVSITMLSYILFILQIRIVLPVIILGLVLFFFSLYKNKKIIPNFTFFNKSKLLWIGLVFTLGVIGQLLVIVPSGSFIGTDWIFYSAHGHDVMWHVALAEQYKQGFPFQMPVFSGERLVNYHFFTDIPIADLSSFFALDSFHLYLKFFPLVFSLLFGGIIYLVTYQVTKKTTAALWATIFSFAAGSFGYIVTWINNGRIGGETLFGASQVQSSIGNPPQIAAFIIFLTFFYFFYKYLHEKNLNALIIGAVLAGSLVGFKVYGGVVLLLSLGFVALLQLIKERKFHIILACMIGGILSLAIFLPNAKSSGSFLLFQPWWFIRTLIVAPDKLNLLDWELRRQTYIAEDNWKRVLQLELTGLFLFITGNLGLRIIGLFSLLKITKKNILNYYNVLFFFCVLFSLVIPLLFVQKGVAGNAIQFMQYALILMGILSGITIGLLFEKLKNIPSRIIISLLLITFMIPTQIGLLYDFYHKNPTSKITLLERNALAAVKENSSEDEVFILPPYNKYQNTEESIPPIWDWFDTAYFSALTSRKSFVADTEQVDIMGYDREARTKILEQLFLKTEDPLEFEYLVANIPADYIYFPLAQKPLIDLSKTSLTKVYENEYAQVWKIN